MKKIFYLITVLFIALSTPKNADAQMIIDSDKSYKVEFYINNISIVNLVVNGGGYTYQLQLDYTIKYIGRNIPKSMWTMQGYLITIDDHDGSYFALDKITTCPEKSEKFGIYVVNGVTISSLMSCIREDHDVVRPSDVVLSLRLEVHGKDLENRVETFPLDVSPLPIELLSFSAKANERQTVFNWSTATEVNNDYFSIEVSDNGVDFATIATISGAGNSNVLKNYSYEYFGANFKYARLRQTDFDGKNETFGMITVKEANEVLTEISVYPNPATSNIMNVSVDNIDEWNLTVYTLDGRAMHTIEHLAFSISMPELKSGMYILMFSNRYNGERISVKYSKR